MSKWILALLLLILLIGWGLSVRQWDADGLWYDEVWSLYNAGGPPDGPLPPWGITERIASQDPDQGIVHPLLLAAWSSAAGWTPFAGRMLSALAGLVAVAVVARLGRRVFSAEVGLFAAAIMLLSPFYIHYTHELRVMTLTTLCIVGLVWTYLDLMDTRRVALRRASMFGFVISGMGLLYTHYFAAIILVAVGLSHVLWLITAKFGPKANDPRFMRRWWQVIGLFVLIGVAFLPWLPVFLEGLRRTESRADVHAKSLVPLVLLEALTYYIGSGLVPLTVILTALGLGAAWRRGREQRVLAGIAAASVIVLMGVQIWLQIIEPGRVRYMIVLWPTLALMMGLGVVFLGQMISRVIGRDLLRPYLGLAFVLLLLNSVRANFDAQYEARMEQAWTPPWQQMTRLVQQQGGPNDLFLFYAGADHARHFYPFTFVMRGLPLAAPAILSEGLVDPTYGSGIQAQIDGAARLWYGIDKTQAQRPVFDKMQALLADQFTLCQTLIDNERLAFALYARESALCPQPAQITYGDALALVGVSGLVPQARTLPISLLWHVGEDIMGVTSVSLQLLDAAGTPVAQKDVGIPGGPYGVIRDALDLAAVPKGRYTLIIIVYRWQSGERLMGLRTATGETGEILPLGIIDYASG